MQPTTKITKATKVDDGDYDEYQATAQKRNRAGLTARRREAIRALCPSCPWWFNGFNSIYELSPPKRRCRAA